MKRIIPIFCAVLILAYLMIDNDKPMTSISQSEQYEAYINPAPVMEKTAFENDLSFWEEKLQSQPNSTTYKLKVAGLLSQQFRQNGNINLLQRSDQLLKSALNTKLGLTAVYQALSANAITQHQFKEAADYAKKALVEGERKDVTYYLLFDAYLELGETEVAKKYLDRQANTATFDYLIRASKLSDASGDLDGAIAFMEQARDRVKDNRKLNIWALSNLADMYGHAGELVKSYETYLEVLDLEPQHFHSLKGISWIAFSHDKNLEAAQKIIEHIQSKKQQPELKLMLADMAEYNGDLKKARNYREAFMSEVTQPAYGDMYNKYIIELLLEEFNEPQLALQKAQEESEKRGGPMINGLLALSHLENGQPELALKITREQVEGKSYEPDVLFTLAKIYDKLGDKKVAEAYYLQCLESRFELGPLAENQILNKVNQ